MTLDLSAINAAAAKLQQQREQQAQAQSAPKTETKAQPKSAPKSKTSSGTKKSAPKTDTPKQNDGASYVIPAEFKQAIEDYLQGRPDMADKLKKRGKSIDKCCEFIYGVMLNRAKKLRNGKQVVGMYLQPEKIFSLAVHYYDESDDDLTKELEKEGK